MTVKELITLLLEVDMSKDVVVDILGNSLDIKEVVQTNYYTELKL
ncbi:MAG: hypothetical protein BWY21_00581 [Parcubacteria group bacterium ADurb.Bin216]|nr:MAG: hypothetical protein BWY21_00581 [Parcubacteria group bacterium ADurb.Bin216]